MIHEGTSMIMTARDGSSVEAGVVDDVRYFEHGPNVGRVYRITVKPLAPEGKIRYFIRNRSQLGGGWINKTHVASISPRSF